MLYPDHLAGIVLRAPESLVQEYGSTKSVLQLRCVCGSRLFGLFISNKRTVHAVCHQCGERAVVYDLEHYPAAIKIPGIEYFEPLKLQAVRPSPVIVVIEYPEPEPDIAFDKNDITWCTILTPDENGLMQRVFSDETC